MATTTHFGWTKPTVGGDNGAWGGILNTVLDDIDADLDTERDRLTLLDDEVRLAQQRMAWAAPSGNAYWVPLFNGGDSLPGITTTVGLNPSLVPLYIPLPVKEGERITEFKTWGEVQGGDSGDASLVRVDSTGAFTVISAGHAITGGLGFDTTSGLTHDVLADNFYAVKINPVVAWSGVSVYGAIVTVTRP